MNVEPVGGDVRSCKLEDREFFRRDCVSLSKVNPPPAWTHQIP
jgi:hypothetical protein